MCRALSAESGPSRMGQRPPACGRICVVGSDDEPLCMGHARLMGRYNEKGTYVAGVRRPAEVLLVLELGAERAREALEPELGRLGIGGGVGLEEVTVYI